MSKKKFLPEQEPSLTSIVFLNFYSYASTIFRSYPSFKVNSYLEFKKSKVRTELEKNKVIQHFHNSLRLLSIKEKD